MKTELLIPQLAHDADPRYVPGPVTHYVVSGQPMRKRVPGVAHGGHKDGASYTDGLVYKAKPFEKDGKIVI